MTMPKTYCPSCGTPVTTAFCTSCGQSVVPPPAPPLFRSPDARPQAPFAAPTRPQAPFAAPTPPQAPFATPTQPMALAAPAPRAPGSGRKLALRALVAFVVLVALGVGGVWGFQWWRDRPAQQALDASNSAVDKVLDKLSSATTIADVSAAGAQAPASLAAVEKQIAGLEDEQSELADHVRPVLAGHRALLEAAAPMEALSEESFSAWGEALPDVQEAQSDLLAARRSLVSYDEGAGEEVTDPRRATEQAVTVVGDAAAETLTGQLTALLADLDAVQDTSGAAALGERAKPLQEAAEASLTGQTGAAEDTLSALSDALSALAGLSSMAPERLYVWAEARTTLAGATESLGVDSAAPMDSMTAWVQSAEKKMARWQASYDQAQSARSSATSSLDTYSEDMKRILRDYDRARDATSDALEAAELDDYSASYDVEYAMEEGVLARQSLLDEMETLDVPPAMADTHAQLMAVVESGVGAMTSGEQAVEDWNGCYIDCTDGYRDMPGWQDFSTQSAQITTRFDTARKAWVDALNGALAQANAVPLPPMPKV